MSTNKDELASVTTMSLVASMINQTNNCALIWNLTGPRKYHVTVENYDFFLGQTASVEKVFSLDVWRDGSVLKSYSSNTVTGIDTLFETVDSLATDSLTSKLKKFANALNDQEGC